MKEMTKDIEAGTKYLVAIIAGFFFSLMLYQVYSLQGRWLFVCLIALILIGVTMIFINRLNDWIIVCLFFSIPVAGFSKWVLMNRLEDEIRGPVIYSGTLGVGITDFLLLGAYAHWLFRIFISGEDPLPRLKLIDGIGLCLIVAYCCSIVGSPDQALGVGAVVYMIKHLLIYFYVSRKIQRQHIPWLIGSILFAIFLETSIGLVQHFLGIARGLVSDRGAMGENLDVQYVVPGIENIVRAAGTTYDSHLLGVYLSMLVPYALIFMLARREVWNHRLVSALMFLMGLLGIIITFGRSAWLGCALSLAIAILVLLRWGAKQALPAVVIVIAALLILGPLVAKYVVTRFTTAPTDVMDVRFQQYPIAMDIWRSHPVFGFGAGNYHNALVQYNKDWALELPVHNAFLWVLADTGVMGFLTFYGMILIAVWRSWRLIWQRNELGRRIALAVFVGLIVYLFDGLTSPGFREPVVYMMLWVSIGLIVALPRLIDDKQLEGTVFA